MHKDYLRHLILKQTFGEPEVILTEYETITKDGESGVADRNKAWWLSERHDAPYLVIKQRGKKGKVVLDFYTTLYELKDSAQEEIGDIFKKMETRFPKEMLEHAEYCGKFGGESPELPMDDLAEYLEELVGIVYDKYNWVLSPEFKKVGWGKDYQENN